MTALALRAAAVAALAYVAPAAGPAAVRPEDTEQWSPRPLVVRPGPFAAAAAPSDALVLLGQGAADQWQGADGGPARWKVADGVLTVAKGTGDIRTRRSFADYQLHLEFRIPAAITGSGQARGNSGLFLGMTGPGAGYELQILDSFGNETYVNGQAGSLYKQYPPRVNPARAPGEWQSYDVVWTAPRFNGDGTLRSPAYLTALFNGVLIHDHVALRGETVFVGAPRYRAHGALPIMLQDHGDPSPPISFRNIWVREL